MQVIDGLGDEDIRAVLTSVHRVALVGASDKTDRPAHEIHALLATRGYRVTPVNPRLAGTTLFGTTVVGTLDAATPLEMVDIFRASEQAGAVVDDAIRLGARVVWMQLGVVDEAAAARARAAGLVAVMNRCPAIEMRRLRIAGPAGALPPHAARGTGTARGDTA